MPTKGYRSAVIHWTTLALRCKVWQQMITRSSAVAERPRDALCLSVASSVQYLERSLLLLVTSASDLPMRTIKFCSVVFGVTSKISVINKIHWCVAQRRLLIAGDGRRISAINYQLSKCWWHATVQQWSMPQPEIGWNWLKTAIFDPVMFIRLDRIQECDRRTDGRTDRCTPHNGIRRAYL